MVGRSILRGMGGDAAVKDPASLMSQHQQYVEDLEAQSRNNVYQILHVIFQESPPRLGWRLPATNQILAHAGLADVHTEFEQFAVNPGGSPGWVRSAHQTDQIAYVFWNRRTPHWPRWTFHVQKRRKPFRCQAITVSGLTTMSAERQSGHIPPSTDQRSRSSGVNFGFFTERCRTPSWCRSARFSNWRAARVLKTDDRATTSVLSIPSVGVRR